MLKGIYYIVLPLDTMLKGIYYIVLPLDTMLNGIAVDIIRMGSCNMHKRRN